ncbi:MAG TPA: hypothetical protein VFC17_13395 [Candidatus Limnocylindrales bacterium]|nr:hypothetical protein [Candidatus Limnocylindrales bacterium]
MQDFHDLPAVNFGRTFRPDDKMGAGDFFIRRAVARLRVSSWLSNLIGKRSKPSFPQGTVTMPMASFRSYHQVAGINIFGGLRDAFKDIGLGNPLQLKLGFPFLVRRMDFNLGGAGQKRADDKS